MIYVKVFVVICLVLFADESVGVTNNQLDVASKGVSNILGKDLKDLIKIPDQKFVKGKVFDFKLVQIRTPDVKIIRKGSTLYVDITDLDIEFNPKWDIQIKVLFFKLKAKGSLSVKITGISIKLKLNIFTFKVLSCKDSIESISLKFSGSNIPKKISSYIEKSFKKLVSRRLKKLLKGKICKAVTSLIGTNRLKIAGNLGLKLR